MSYRNINIRCSVWVVPIISIGAPIIYFLSKHADLARKINHQTIKGVLTPSTIGDIKSVPAAAIAQECPVIYDIASTVVKASSLPAVDDDALLKQYLRHTMQRFSNFPQAWMLRLICTTSERKTFSPSHIRNLNFKEGDVVCGAYTVVARSAGTVEFSLKAAGSVNGRLSITIATKGEDVVFRTETIMWKGNGEKMAMPLERKVFKWMHELASWYLLESGTQYLINSKKPA